MPMQEQQHVRTHRIQRGEKACARVGCLLAAKTLVHTMSVSAWNEYRVCNSRCSTVGYAADGTTTCLPLVSPAVDPGNVTSPAVMLSPNAMKRTRCNCGARVMLTRNSHVACRLSAVGGRAIHRRLADREHRSRCRRAVDVDGRLSVPRFRRWIRDGESGGIDGGATDALLARDRRRRRRRRRWWRVGRARRAAATTRKSNEKNCAE